LTIAAASRAFPAFGETAQATQSGLPGGFNQYTQDYAQFCALPPKKRVFYEVSDGKIVESRLNDTTWKGFFGRHRDHRNVQSLTDGLSDFAEYHALLGDRVVHRAGLRLFHREPVEPRIE